MRRLFLAAVALALLAALFLWRSPQQKIARVEPEIPPVEARELASPPEEGARPDRSASPERQVEQMREILDAALRDLQSRCDRGNSQACAEIVCGRLMSEGATAERYTACATAKGFKTTRDWAQMSALSPANDSRLVNVVCLRNPEELDMGGKSFTIFRTLELRADDYFSVKHERDRFYDNTNGGPDFATWEEAADAFCSASRPDE